MEIFLSCDQMTILFAEYIKKNYPEYNRIDSWDVTLDKGAISTFNIKVSKRMKRKSSFNKNDKSGFD